MLLLKTPSWVEELCDDPLAVPQVTGEVLPAAVPAGNVSNDFTIKNNVSSYFYVFGINVSYPDTFGDVLINLTTGIGNRQFLANNIKLSAIATTLNSGLSSRLSIPFFPIFPFMLTSNNYVLVTLRNVTGNPLPAQSVNVNLWGINSGTMYSQQNG